MSSCCNPSWGHQDSSTPVTYVTNYWVLQLKRNLWNNNSILICRRQNFQRLGLDPLIKTTNFPLEIVLSTKFSCRSWQFRVLINAWASVNIFRFKKSHLIIPNSFWCCSRWGGGLTVFWFSEIWYFNTCHGQAPGDVICPLMILGISSWFSPNNSFWNVMLVKKRIKLLMKDFNNIYPKHSTYVLTK